MTINKNRLKDN